MAGESKQYMSGKDVLLNPDGTTYHLGTKAGEVYPRIITVGSLGRAKSIAETLFGSNMEVAKISARMMATYSGKYNGQGITVIGIGMGAPMMDFMVREASFCLPDQPMAVVRLGTCGIFNKDLKPGTCITAKACTCSFMNPGYFTDGFFSSDEKPKHAYYVTKPLPATADLNESLGKALRAEGLDHHDGLNNAAETFFAAQGRQDTHFNNGDNSCIEKVFAEHKFDSCEMESFTLFHLRQFRKIAPLYSAACHMGILNRVNDNMPNIEADKMHEIEAKMGVAAAKCLASYDLTVKHE